MKENVLDVLLYLFENYIDTDADDAKKPDKDALEVELEKLGFLQLEIHKAFEWLESMTVVSEDSTETNNQHSAMRLFSDEEQERLDLECRGYLLFLEQVGVLDAETREIVVERVLALDEDEIDLDQMKWVVLMVLFYQPGREVAYAWMEDLVFEDLEAVIH